MVLGSLRCGKISPDSCDLKNDEYEKVNCAKDNKEKVIEFMDILKKLRKM